MGSAMLDGWDSVNEGTRLLIHVLLYTPHHLSPSYTVVLHS